MIHLCFYIFLVLKNLKFTYDTPLILYILTYKKYKFDMWFNMFCYVLCMFWLWFIIILINFEWFFLIDFLCFGLLNVIFCLWNFCVFGVDFFVLGLVSPLKYLYFIYNSLPVWYIFTYKKMVCQPFVNWFHL